MAESEEEKLFIELPNSICASWVHPFSFPVYKSPDTKDDLVLYHILLVLFLLLN